ncbi:MAG: hypothetical protein IPQ07_24025 [Myxococcales bacterium]|nr:hypothetical protein [Myxococcales bacterium]
MRVRHRQRGLIALAAVVLATAVASAEPSLLDGLATEDPQALAAAVTAIEHAPTTPDLADALFGAARACEDRLLDPARALVLYERILAELPETRVAQAASRRAEQLRAELGPHHEHAHEAAAFAQLIAAADTLPTDELLRRADALAAAPWPGAPDVALWTAEVLRRQRRFSLALPRYAEIVRRWPERAASARLGGAGTAIEAHDWALAEQLIDTLPAADPADRLIRDNLVADLDSGRRAARGYLVAWIALGLAVLGLLGSLVEASLRGGWRRPSLRPPTEVMFLAPVAVVLVVIAFAARAVVAPAVAQISIAGIVFAWLSGTTLDLLRARGRGVRIRSIVHALACGAGAIAIGYIAIVHGELLELLAETVQAGPG